MTPNAKLLLRLIWCGMRMRTDGRWLQTCTDAFYAGWSTSQISGALTLGSMFDCTIVVSVTVLLLTWTFRG